MISNCVNTAKHINWVADCAAVIPCLNEATTIGPLVESVQRQVPTVIVVDDGSNDGTQSAAQAVGARVLRHNITRGKGAALQSGWRCAFDSEFAWALCLDGDGQHSPDDISSFFRRAEETLAPLVVGNRMADASHMPLVRRLVNRWMSRQLSGLTGQILPDSQCGFRLMNLRAWASLQFQAQYFEIESEVLLAFLQAHLKVDFVPIRAIYKSEQSKIHPFRDSLRWWRWWRRARSKNN